MTDSFPRLHARTRRFTLGAPRGFTVAPDGSRAVFLRSRGGTDPVTCLWSVDAATGSETLLLDPLTLGADEENLPAAERARRERVREQAGGVVGYAADAALGSAVVALSGRPYLVDLTGGTDPRALDVGDVEAVVDPRLDPTGSRVAFVADRALHVHDVATGSTAVLVAPDGERVSHGLADFAAAEEMNRTRGYWWSPDGTALLVARVDESPVARWWIADPANPDRSPTPVAYPAAGTANALVTLEVVALDGTRTPVDPGGSSDDTEYLVSVSWDGGGPLVVVQTRDQTALRILAVDPATGATTPLRETTDPVWVEIVPGVPARLPGGGLLHVADDGGARRLFVGDRPLTDTSMQVRDVLDVDGDTVLFRASTDPISIRLFTVTPGADPVPASPEHGVHGGTLAGGTLVRTSTDLGSAARTVLVRPDGTELRIASHAAEPGLVPRIALHAFGARELRTAVLLPTGHEPGSGTLPVLLDPYGGPHSQRVLAARNAHLTSQWFADHGFAVVVVDGRGTPGRGPDWERAVHHDLASPVLEDQVDALHAAAAEYPDLDLGRVGIRGWSFGGYLAALAVLRRPDVFHAGIAGAPVTDWALYDTHYTERYLGQDTSAESYRRSSVLDDAAAPGTTRPLMIIHGLADDNVVAAHTLRLSSALLAAGRAHEVLPLSGVTHMTPQEVVAENLLLLQVRFLRDALRDVPGT